MKFNQHHSQNQIIEALTTFLFLQHFKTQPELNIHETCFSCPEIPLPETLKVCPLTISMSQDTKGLIAVSWALLCEHQCCLADKKNLEKS